MTMIWIYRLIERRSKEGNWSYVLCATVALFYGVLGVGMEGDVVVGVPYLVLIVLCLVQFFRPTLLVWGLLLAAFGAAAIAMVVNYQEPAGEWMLFFLCVAIPACGLLYTWPRAVARRN